MSDRTLWEVYLPPFKAAVEAGAATFMNSFNDLNGSGVVPHPEGEILVTYIMKADQLNVNVVLPQKISGVFRWHGKTQLLNSGENLFTIRK